MRWARHDVSQVLLIILSLGRELFSSLAIDLLAFGEAG
jgi:hypothetical protein